MRRLNIFLIILTVTLGALLILALVGWYLAVSAPSYYGSSWMGQMWGGMMGSSYGGMGGMMGGGYYGGSGTAAQSYLWMIPVTLIAVSVVAMTGVVFYLVYPELRYIRGSCNPQGSKPVSSIVEGSVPAAAPVSPVVSNVATASNSCDVLLKTMTPEEQRVLNVLINHRGKYLQKYIAKEAVLSRLKTHRIIARFAQRGIVTVKEFGNTNEVLLSDWVTTQR
jgi:uncharacterized membrane protein